jgi:hypothetical protein
MSAPRLLPRYTTARTEDLHVCDLELLCLRQIGKPLDPDPYVANVLRENQQGRRSRRNNFAWFLVGLCLVGASPFLLTPVLFVPGFLIAVSSHLALLRYTALWQARTNEESIIPTGCLARDLHPSTWAKFLAKEVLTFFSRETMLVSVGDGRLLADGDFELIALWGEEAQRVDRETAEEFLAHYEITFSSYLSFCRGRRLQPWANLELPLDWFVGYRFVGTVDGEEPSP